MKKPDTITRPFRTVQEKKRVRRFWLLSFAVYALAAAVYWMIYYFITLNKCRECLEPLPYYFTQWLVGLLFTALLWLALDFFYNRKPALNILLNIILFIVHYFLWLIFEYQLEKSGLSWLSSTAGYNKSVDDFVYESWFDMVKYVLTVSAYYLLKFYISYRQSERQRIELAVLNKDMQLNLLRQQLNPHFYFNTLNNLYGLARSNNPRLTEALAQLSNIMQYVIVDCNGPRVLLSQELNFLESYIALEKLRYEQNTPIDILVDGHPNGQLIMPMLLVQFVENAFKHGMKEKSDANWMKVHFRIKNDDLFFSVDNSYYEEGISRGIGLSSVQHRLDLQYEGKYEMKMLHEANRFSVT
ncbi:MAG TPA: histidine kinase, partial [Chitinophagaceae bacterium]|nr:histidine kinase [Chitinophagaceae bacterium]